MSPAPTASTTPPAPDSRDPVIIGNGFDQADAVSMRVHNPSSDTVRGRPRGTMVEHKPDQQAKPGGWKTWIERARPAGNFPLPAFCATQAAAAPAASYNLTPFVFQYYNSP